MVTCVIIENLAMSVQLKNFVLQSKLQTLRCLSIKKRFTSIKIENVTNPFAKGQYFNVDMCS